MIPKPHNPNRYGKSSKANEKQKKQSKLILEDMRKNFKPKPISQVKKMFSKHHLKWIKGKGIFQM